MSAFICSNKTISAIVNTPSMFCSDAERAELGQVLFDANVESCVTLAESKGDTFKLDHKFEFIPGIVLTPVEMIKACDCYLYQSCEVENFEETRAAKMVEVIKQFAVQNLPGYSDALWDL